MRRLCPLLLLCACAPAVQDAGPAFIAPLDGQTAVPEDLDLLLSTGGLDLPPDYPVSPEVLQVVDLVDGGFVPGEVWRDGFDLRFTPDQGWQSGHDYVWTVSDPPVQGRQPQYVLRDGIKGEATFRAGDGDAILDAGIGNLGAVCLLMSRALDTVPEDLLVELDNAAVLDGLWQIRTEWAPGKRIRLLEGDPGVNLVCWEDAPKLQGGESLRVWWGTEGPWRFTLDFVVPEALSREERRRVW